MNYKNNVLQNISIRNYNVLVHCIKHLLVKLKYTVALTNEVQTLMLSYSRKIKFNAALHLNLIGEPYILHLKNSTKFYPMKYICQSIIQH